VCFWLAVWQLASIVVGNDILLAGPVQTLARLAHDALTLPFWQSVGLTFLHILVGFLVAAICAVVLSFCAWKVPFIGELLAPLVSFMKSVPVVCIIVLLLMWVGSARVSSIAVGLMVFPPVYFSCLEGFGQEDPAMREMLDVFEVGALRRIRFYYAPLVLPYLVASLKVVVGISWKAGIAAEVIGIPAGTVGEQVYLSKITLDSARLFAWTFTIVGLSALCERAVLAGIDRLFHAVSDSAGKPASVASAPAASDASRPTNGSDHAQAASLEPQAIGLEHVTFAYPDGLQSSSETRQSSRRGRRSASGNAESSVITEATEGRSDQPGSAAPLSAGTTEPHAPDHTRPVLDDVSLDLEPGGRLCVMGPSGVGKTTLLRIMCESLRPTSGTATTPAHVSCSFQEDRLLTQLSAWDNVRVVVGDAAGADLARFKGELDRLLGADSTTLAPDQLSGGMKRKVSLVRALAAPSQAVILDEPFAGLDDASRHDAVACIERNLDGRTLVVATHDAADATLLGARVMTLGAHA
jgi:NitT/TauT family transport system permease protein